MHIIFLIIFIVGSVFSGVSRNSSFFITKDSPAVISPVFFDIEPVGGDTIFIMQDRTQALVFENFKGNPENPLVFINYNGQVNINSTDYWSALEFNNCRYIKVSGNGFSGDKYGFKLKAQNCGLAFTGLSSDCELEFVHIDDEGFFGIMAKKDYSGFPPYPIPVFENLIIHDCFIENVYEGMYLGETATPGMEFKHIRIFNNIVVNTQREGIQIANMVEDVEIYNNIIINSGLESAYSQGNNMQIGDNSIANIYNNILIDAYGSGIIVLGAGEINIRNNYLSNNHGIFIDNRSVTIEEGEIIISGNYFHEIINDYIINNSNELNLISISDNVWYGSFYFLNDNSGNPENLKESNNLQQSFIPLEFENQEEDNFTLSQANPEIFLEMGPQEGLSYTLNNSPVLDSTGNIFIDWDKDTVVLINASVLDNDILEFKIEDLPEFVTYEEISNGKARIIINPEESDIGKYTIKIKVSDQSHQANDRETLNIVVRNPNNSPPRLYIENEFFIETLSSENISIEYFDYDGDEVSITALNLPAFAELIKINQDFYLQIKTLYTDAGIYDTIRIIADDGFGLTDTAFLTITVNSRNLDSGMPIFRVNCGGPVLEDSILNWEGGYYQRLMYEVSENHHTGSHSWKGVNTTGAPDFLFGPWSYVNVGGEEMKWAFPCENGNYIVNLYFAEREEDVNSIGSTVFDININENQVEQNFSIFEEAGYSALKKSYDIKVNNQKIEIELLHVINNTKLNGIEIVYMGPLYTNRSEYLIENHKNEKSILFPVPASDYLYIKPFQGDDNQKLSIDIMNLHGEIINSLTRNVLGENMIEIYIDRNQISSGYYIVKIKRESGSTENISIIIR